jgi:hypothetical protein
LSSNITWSFDAAANRQLPEKNKNAPRKPQKRPEIPISFALVASSRRHFKMLESDFPALTFAF